MQAKKSRYRNYFGGSWRHINKFWVVRYSYYKTYYNVVQLKLIMISYLKNISAKSYEVDDILTYCKFDGKNFDVSLLLLIEFDTALNFA